MGRKRHWLISIQGYRRRLMRMTKQQQQQRACVILSQYNIIYLIRKAVKGSVIADLLAENPINDYEALDFEFPDEYINAVGNDVEGPDVVWEMYFDGAVNLSSNGIGAMLVALDGKHFPIAVKLRFGCTNNVTEYEAYVSGLQAALEMKIRKLKKYLLKLIKEFEEISFTHLSRDKNQFTDALATLAVMTQMEEGQIMQLLQIKARSKPAYRCMIEEETDSKPWYHDIQMYIKNREYPPGANRNKRRMIRRLALGYFPNGKILYKRTSNGELLNAKEARRILFKPMKGTALLITMGI
ncbi:uncharacterized protein LOC131181339 [Hevea brasiliensis]|uniref:uncharacterized protein LOC131181339 n=1 Tax=Hevea brasiliensis TaxID=3981 RepID=UPI0025E92320|nr:uncharacterized protein LOC131181339 [Hevea brasiliensis]